MEAFFKQNSKYRSQYELVQKAIPVVIDHWDFWSNIVSFGNSCSNGELMYTQYGWWRHRRGMSKLKLINYSSLEGVQKEITSLKQKYDVQTLSWSWKNLPEKYETKDADFYIDADFDFEFRRLKSKHRGNIKRAYRAGEERYVVKLAQERDKLVVKGLFNSWVDWAVTRHHTVFKAHYQRWLQLYFEGAFEKNAYLFCFWEGNNLVAITGFEIIGNRGMLLIVKHKENISPEYIWLWTLQKCKELGAEVVLCGSTAEVFKRRLGFKEKQTCRFCNAEPAVGSEIISLTIL